jgi:sirohydrochlorin cobaltochelatase
MSETAVLLCGHGSRDPEAVGEFEAAAAALRLRLANLAPGTPGAPGQDFTTGYLEFARPTIGEGLTTLASRGARRILAIPGMLFAASHVKNDLPWEMNSFMAANPGIEVRLGRDLGIDPKLLDAAAARIAAAVPDGRSETLLVVVGRGTNDPDANSNIAKIARMLWEGMGFGWAEAAFSGVADPRVDAALERSARLGFRRIVVFPYFLFTGILVKRIYAQTDAVAARHPEIEFVKAGYLGDHEGVIEAFVDRALEFGDGGNPGGDPAMNCQLCKYRTRIIGYEDAVGTPQQGHHHHVRGAGVDHHHPHPHDHDHAHPHDHDHAHPHDHGHAHRHDHHHEG